MIFGNLKTSMKYYNSKLCTFIQVHFKSIFISLYKNRIYLWSWTYWKCFKKKRLSMATV